MKKADRSLLKNTVMLYILTFSTYFFNLIVVPYQTRVLGPVIYGKLGFASAAMSYVQLFLDFGFILSATEEVSRNRDNKQRLCQILTAVTICKLILGLISCGIIAVLCVAVDKFREDVLLYFLFFAWIFVNSLLPDFLYRGIEEMSVITYRTVAIKFFFTVMVFLTLKDASQYYVIPILNLLGVVGACIWLFIDLKKRLNVYFVRVKPNYVWTVLKKSSTYFASRIASTVYGATNTFILGMIDKTGIATGYYASADKLTSTARSAFSPIADSLYPYMVKNRNFKIIKKILIVFMPVIILGCLVLGFLAEDFCALFFGEEYRGAGIALKILLPSVVFAFPNYILGFPTLSPLDLSKHANISVILGATFQIVQLVVFAAMGNLQIKTICLATSVTELIVLLYRVVIILTKGRQKLNQMKE